MLTGKGGETGWWHQLALILRVDSETDLDFALKLYVYCLKNLSNVNFANMIWTMAIICIKVVAKTMLLCTNKSLRIIARVAEEN